MIVEIVSTVTVDVIANLTKDAAAKIKDKIGGDVKLNQENLNFYSDKINSTQYVRTIRELDEVVSIFDFFVPLDMVKKEDSKPKKIKCLEILSSEKPVLMLGIVGHGKSTLMRVLAVNDFNYNKKFSFFYELKNISDNLTLDGLIKDLFNDWMNVNDFKLMEKMLNSGGISIFFDGFDEVGLAKENKVSVLLEKFVNKYKKVKVVVSSRYDCDLERSTVFEKYSISKLGLETQKSIINKVVGSAELQNSILESIRIAKIEIKKLLITPLMVNLYILTFNKEQILPETVSQFYSRLFDLVLRRHDNTKIAFSRERKSKLDQARFQEVFRSISYLCCRNEKYTFNYTDFNKIVENSLRNLKIKNENVDDIIDDIVSILCLIIKEGDNYDFIHRSISEYYAAEFISNYGKSEVLYEDINRNYYKYRVVCIFLESIDKYNFYKNFLLDKYEEACLTISGRNFIDHVYIGRNDKQSVEIKIFMHGFFSSFLSDLMRERIFPVCMRCLKNSNKYKIGNMPLSVTLNFKTKEKNGKEIVLNNADSISTKQNGQTIYNVNNGISEDKILDSGYDKLFKVSNIKDFAELKKELYKFCDDVENKLNDIRVFIESNEQDGENFIFNL
ncbi:NACHT domain-containing protein [Acinetobacter johnsonii]|uniref:NACHT domain-containing protein n=1 Tax=Acinetobacter johnsonii TaxID=40214 RepID=UPI0039850D11